MSHVEIAREMDPFGHLELFWARITPSRLCVVALGVFRSGAVVFFWLYRTYGAYGGHYLARNETFWSISGVNCSDLLILGLVFVAGGEFIWAQRYFPSVTALLFRLYSTWYLLSGLGEAQLGQNYGISVWLRRTPGIDVPVLCGILGLIFLVESYFVEA